MISPTVIIRTALNIPPKVGAVNSITTELQMGVNYKVWYILLTRLEDLVVFIMQIMRIIQKNMETLYWKTNDGRVMNVDDMSDTHVRNAFKLLLRKISKTEAKIDRLMVLHNDVSLNGDMALEFNNSLSDYEYEPYCEL